MGADQGAGSAARWQGTIRLMFYYCSESFLSALLTFTNKVLWGPFLDGILELKTKIEKKKAGASGHGESRSKIVFLYMENPRRIFLT